jgi:hypothetical protein
MTRNYRCAAFIEVHATAPRVEISSHVGERGSELAYASLLAHEAFHNMLFCRNEISEGPTAERRCTDFQLEILRELQAPQSLIETTEGSKRFPYGKLLLDDWFWRSMDWRRSSKSDASQLQMCLEWSRRPKRNRPPPTP